MAEGAALPAAIGRYRIVRQVTAGVFGRVLLAHDPALDRRIAIKLFSLSDEAAESLCYDLAEWRRRFVQEARILARLDHPHVIAVHEMGWLAGEPWLAMPYMAANLRAEIGCDIDDPELPEPLRPHAVDPARAAELLRQVLAALAALHAAGIVHRDVKPTNLLLTGRNGGLLKLCDFGYAKTLGQVEPRRDAWFGSPDYISPEQAYSAAAATDRSDIYSVGVLAWRMLTGRLPPDGALPAGLPDGFAALVGAAMAADPSARPSAVAMLVALDRMRRAG